MGRHRAAPSAENHRINLRKATATAPSASRNFVQQVLREIRDVSVVPAREVGIYKRKQKKNENALSTKKVTKKTIKKKSKFLD